MSSLPKRPLEGILKKNSHAAAEKPARDPEAEQVALKHAAIIQERRNLEDEIFNNINSLTDLPLLREAPYSSANPAPFTHSHELPKYARLALDAPAVSPNGSRTQWA